VEDQAVEHLLVQVVMVLDLVLASSVKVMTEVKAGLAVAVRLQMRLVEAVARELVALMSL
jgi:hypothetical protein